MHYRHHFHAGNFADVFKHVLLTGLLTALSRKEKPFLYLDTHAGAGVYDLNSAEALRSAEAAAGVSQLMEQTAPPEWTARYLALVSLLESTRAIRKPYPGSPALAAKLLREGDRLVCCENQEGVAEQLRYTVPNAAIHVRSGYESHGFLPPPEKRGLVLMDPPFEDRREFSMLEEYLKKSLARWSNGIFAIWYPVKQAHDPERFVRRVRAFAHGDVLECTIDTGARSQGQMHACGMLIIHPPFGFETQARTELGWLTTRLAQGPRPVFSVELRQP
tara:strand:+ start:727 stop:1551 length:825 start_codon:yes stop_codon:yes gene_type:complete